ncbi:MAG: sigma-70 family RNA polymerase sigma factor [Isosphaeraceae bacterium]
MFNRDIEALFQLGVLAGKSDGQLLERFNSRQAGASEAAFEEIVRRHGAMVLGVCHRALGNRDAAEDAFQATFLVLALRARSVERKESLGPWLHGVAARVARRAQRVERRRRETTLPEHGLTAPGPLDPVQRETASIVDAELERLPEKYRRPVVLCYLEGKSQEEAASTLGWSKGTVSGRLARAKDLLRSRLARRGLAPPAALLGAGLAAEARAAVSGSLLLATVRAATAARLAGMEASLVSGSAALLARGVLGAMFLGRVKLSAPLLLLGVGAAVMGAPFFRGVRPAARPDAHVSSIRRHGTLVQVPGPASFVGVAFTPDGKTAISALSDGLVQFWDPASGQMVRSLDLLKKGKEERTVLRGFALSPDGSRLAGAGLARGSDGGQQKGTVWIWSTDGGELLHKIGVGSAGLECLAFSPEGASVATGNRAGMIQFWDVTTGEELLTLRLGRGVIRWLAFSPDGMTLAASDEASGLQLWSLAAGRALGVLAPNSPRGVLAPSFSPDGRLLAFATTEGELVVWDRAGGRTQATARFDWQDPPAIVFAPDSRSLAISGDTNGRLSVIDTETGRRRWTVGLGAGLGAGGLAYAPDGKTIISGRGNVLKLVDADGGDLIEGRADRLQSNP